LNKMSILIQLSIPLLVLVTGCSTNEETGEDAVRLPVDTLEVIAGIGVEVGDSTNTFAAIADVRIDERGRVLVLDEVEACIKVFDSEGNYIQQVSRRGEGPGELDDPVGLFVMPDGRVGVVDQGKHGYVVFNDSLRFHEEIGLWATNSPYHVTPISNDEIAACRYDDRARGEFDVLSRTVAVYSWGEQDPDTVLWQDSLETTFADAIDNLSMLLDYALFNSISTCSDGNGTIYFAPADPHVYEITGWDSTGTVVLEISRELEPVEKTQEDIESETFYANSYLQRISTGPVPFEYEPAPYRIMVDELGFGPDGNLWVKLGTHNETFFDIYDLNGRLLRHAVFPTDGWSWETEVTPHGILAWEEDPLSGYQVLYLLE